MAIAKGRFKIDAEKEREEEKKSRNYFVLPTLEELQAIEQEAKEDAAKVASSERGLEFFKTPDVWDPDASTGEKIANAGKIALGTLGDVGVGTVKGVMKMGEGIGDALQYGAAAVTDLFGADETAERIRKNAQREAVADAFRGVDEKLDRYSVLGRTADAGTEALGQIGGILATGGIAGALGAGAAGTTAVTTGVMGASSFGSGTSEAYAAGADEGEAEAYGAIAGAADALSEMIFGGLGKGIHALGVSKGLSSADDMLAKALSSRIRNTLAKNTVQLGVKAGAEGLEEVLAGTMQAAGKKMTYMSERDFLDILEDENLLEQFVVGALASGIAQTPGYVSANRAGVDLVSDGGTDGTEGAEDTQASTNPHIEEIERTGRAVGADDGTIALARDVSSLTGRGVRFFSEAENDGYINNGFYDPDSNTININVKSKNPSAQILSHELTHSIENTDSYLQLRSVIFDRMKRDGMDIDAEYRKKELLYNDAGYRLRDEGEIAHEIIAEQIEKRYLTDEASIRSLVSENRTLGQRIREWFDSLLAKMGNAEAKERDYVRQVRDLYARALGESVTMDGGNVRHSINPEFVSRLESWDKKTEGFAFVLGNTSEALKKAGIPDKQIRMDASKIKTLLEKHDGMTVDIVKQIPELLEKPVLVIDSKKNDDSKIVMGELYDENNKPVTVVLLLAPSSRGGNVLDMIKISSAEGRGHISSLFKKEDGTPVKIRYADKERIRDWLYVNRLQLPLRNLGLDSDNSISQNGGNVKGENAGNAPHSISKVDDQRYKEAVDRDDMETAQRMVNEAAKAKGWIPVTRYHQTGTEFTKFSNENPDAGLNDSDTPNGFFFKENDHDIGVGGDYVKTGHGGNIQMPVYLKMEKVLSFKNRDDARSWYTKNVPGYMELLKKYEEYQAEYKRLDNENTRKMFEELEQLDESGEYTASKADAVMKKYDAVIDDWIEKTKDYETGLRSEMRKLLNDFFLNGNSEYDAIELEDDGHRYIDGKREDVHTYIVFKNTQIKSSKPVTYDDDGNVIPLSERFKRDNDDIRYSVSKVMQDSEGRQLSDGQREYFKESKVIDEDGRLKVMYHGTPSGGFTKFDTYGSNYGLFGTGAYFTDNRDVAAGYTNKRSNREGKKEVYEVYLNITNPMDMDAPADAEAWRVAYPDADFPTTGSNEDFFRAMEQSFEDDMLPRWEAGEIAQGVIAEMGYDGITHIGGGRFNKADETRHRVYIAFEQEQIKRVDNERPTSNPDIRYSVSKSDEQDNKRVMPKRSAAGTKARARQDQQTRMRFEQKVMNRGFDNLSPAEQEHYRNEIVGQYRRKYDDYKKKRDALTASGYQFAGVDDYAEKVVGSVEDAAIDANTFLAHYQEGVFGDPTREDVQDFALDYLQMIGAHRPDTSETYVETQDSEMPGDEDAPPERGRGVQMEYGEPEAADVDGEGEPKLTRKVLHKTIMDGIKEQFSERGLDLDRVFAKAKDLSTFSTVDNTPQRVMEKSLGYQAGQALSDLTVNRVAENETAGIRWLNQYTSKDGVIAGLAKKYNIKPGSKESAAAQMYAEGFYVNEYDEIVEYGDRELAADFPDAQVQKNIKGLARDPVIRQIYDQTLDAINASRARNAYPEIQKLDNYYLHFRAMDDTFSRLGVPFNPNDIRAKDLPTDLNGVTADLKPGQPYFASAMHRKGKRTSFDLLGGLEKYLTSAKNQIYHIDDIQTLRALRNYIADMYGQGNGLQGLDDMDEDAVQERIKQVYDSHLSTFAKFLNEEANIIAGKTSLIDRGLEGVIGRRGITFLNDVNRQVGANMVGWNVSSSLTNVLPVVQAFAKTNKLAFVKGFAQTVQNRLASITGQGDGFAETSDVIVRRKGADRYHRTPWQKASDAGYLLMGMVDDISTEIIARAKYNELTAKGMDAETANRETDKWVSRLMGDRSLGQMPQIFNSKMLGMITKFQLEVRNQIDAQFYDTIKEAQADYAEIGDKAKRNAKIAAKVTATFAELAIAQHLFGAVFESIAGYNPAFDIIEVLAKVIGLDDDEESEDTVLDNIEQGVLALIEDLPYSSVLMDGGRVPISAAMPIGDIIKGEDQYGNEVNRLQTVAEALPYYVLPGGYGQIKKTAQGLSMFAGDRPVTGSYTDSGNLRFPVEATPGNVAQAAVFGQWANENARDYFDNERKPISERQAQGYAESDLGWKEYQKYKAQITKLEKGADKVSAIKELDISPKAKEALYRSLVATTVKDEDGNIIGTSEDGKIEALYNVGLDFNDFLDVKMKQASLNADESLSGNGRATRFLAWVSKNGYTDAQADVVGEQFAFSSGFRVSPTTYQKMVDGGVEPDNAVAFSDALSGTERAIDKINAMWGTGIGGKQLDAAIKAVVSEKQYENYHIIIDANVPLDAYTWVLDNADIDGNGSISNEEREVTLSRLALDPSDLSALWLATGGSEKSNPYKGSAFGIKMPEINIPQIEMPELDFNIPHFDFEFKFGGNKT